MMDILSWGVASASQDAGEDLARFCMQAQADGVTFRSIGIVEARMVPEDVCALAALVGEAARRRKVMLATAESCTGGLVAGALTAVAGSSDWFAGGVVAYANAVKTTVLGVPQEVLAAHGAVSAECVIAMARGVCRVLGTSGAVAISGIAGPGGGTPTKPVGLVWMAWVVEDTCAVRSFHFSGDRAAVRTAAVRAALVGLGERL